MSNEDASINRMRSMVRPIMLLWCTAILSMLVIMLATGAAHIPEGSVAETIVARARMRHGTWALWRRK